MLIIGIFLLLVKLQTMKKLFIVGVLFCFSTLLNAQSWHAGANLGFNSVWIANQNNYGFSELNYEYKWGGFVGLAAGYNFNMHSGVQLELDFVQMGQDYFAKVRDFGPTNNSGTQDKVDTYRYVDLNYFQIPVMYRYTSNRNKSDKLAFHAMAGPSFGFLLSADQYYEADVENNGQLVEIPLELIAQAIPAFAATPEKEEAKAFFNSTDIGAQIDLGLDIFISDNLYVTTAAKVYYGFSDNNAEETRERTEYEPSHNFYIGINAGIHFMQQM